MQLSQKHIVFFQTKDFVQYMYMYMREDSVL